MFCRYYQGRDSACAELARRFRPSRIVDMEKRKTVERAEYETHSATWRGIRLEIRHCPGWFSSAGDDFVIQHIEIRSEDKRMLPITNTGYRSYFMIGAEALIDFDHDPVELVLWWLDEAATDPKWKRREEEDRQGSLF